MCYDEYEKIYAEAVISINKRLVRLIDVTMAQGDDEVQISDEESSDPDGKNLIEENKVVEIFRIETNVFDFEKPTYDGYCNGGNLSGAYIVGNTLHYQDLEWYEALKDGKIKQEALLNKSIMEGTINEEEESLDET
nr:hypothetical protein [Tanacetum cinerariifolium]